MIRFAFQACCVVAALWYPAHAQPCSVETSSTELVRERGYSLAGQTHVITGGDSDIGLHISEALALAGARVIMLAHDVQKTGKVIQDMANKTGNSKISSVAVDLMSLASVKAAADDVLRLTDRVDAVICHAGSIDPPLPPVTADGFESAFALEYIGHFSLVEVLLPKLRAAGGRVVMTSTASLDLKMLCPGAGLPDNCYSIDSLKTLVHEPNQKGFGNVMPGLYLKTMHARIIAKREALSGVTAYAYNPGTVATHGTVHSKVFAALGGVERVAKQCSSDAWWGCACHNPDGTGGHCPLTPRQGAVSGAYLAAAPKSELAPVNGQLTVACGQHPTARDPDIGYLDPYDQMVSMIGEASTEAYLQRLYELSLSWIDVGGRSAVVQTAASRLASKSIAFAALAAVGVAVLVLVARRHQRPDLENYRLITIDNEA